MIDNWKLSEPSRDIDNRETLIRFVEHGYVVAKAPGELSRSIQQTYAAAMQFFLLPLAPKMQSRLPLDSGYRPFGVEYSQSGGQPDDVESFSVHYRCNHPISSLESVAAEALRYAMLQTFDTMEPTVERFVATVACHFTGRSHFEEYRNKLHSCSILQVNHSRPNNAKFEFTNESHEDGCLISVLCPMSPGLELMTSAGTYLPIVLQRDELLIISGEIIWLLSGGNIKPTFHRVRPDQSLHHRLSLLFFADLDPAVCAPWIYNQVNAEVDIRDRILKNSLRFGLSEWLST